MKPNSFRRNILRASGLVTLGATHWLSAQTASLTVEAGRPVAKVSPMHYGLMTEEINYSYDGGLYAELVRNRVFKDDPQNPVHWSAVQGTGATATIALDQAKPLNEVLTTSLRLEVTAASATGRAGIANDGYWGIPVKPDTTYRASFHAKAGPGFAGPVTVAIESEDGATVYAHAEVPALTTDWKAYSVALVTAKVTPTSKAQLVLTVSQPATIWFNLVSLFPPTWKNRSNGNRIDLMQLLADMQPRFLRFPGGNYLQGDTIEDRFPWKKTLGPLTQRPGHAGPWGYRSTDGMGLLEFLLWCEDLNMEPILGIYAGYNLGNVAGKPNSIVKAGPDMLPYIQEALDEIEYIIGPVSTKWGAQRARDGHPAPFRLTYVEIGNEDWFDKNNTYDARFAQFYDALKKKYPKLQLISSIGNEQPANKRVHTRKPDVIDEHYYRSVEEFEKMAPAYYEKYDRKGPKIFVGEWAAHETDFPPWDRRSEQMPATPNMKAALGDAAWMTAMERNSDLVVLQCYAPLLVNVNPGGRQWRPDLIGYDALSSYGAPSYYAFQMFSRNVGDSILKTTLTGSPIPPLHFCATKDTRTGMIYLKLVNTLGTPAPIKIILNGAATIAPTATAITLAASPTETNSLQEPTKVVPVSSKVNGIKNFFDYTVAPYSITVLQLSAR